jgi:RHS repeat-associated protein
MYVKAGPTGVIPPANTPQSASMYSNNQLPTSGGIYSYDAAGNETFVNGNTVTYDAENRQTGVSGTGVNETYVYDGDGRRVGKVSGAAGSPTTVFVYDAMGRMAAEYSSVTDTPSCVTCYMSPDQLGTPRLITDQNGSVVARHDYLPFGEEVGANAGRGSQWAIGNDSINQKFTGKERDSESGLDYFGARYYGSALGRFTRPDDGSDQDPGNPQSWNLYSYVRNKPLTNTDPTGQDCVTTSQTSTTLTVTTERGGSSDTCSGTYVDGTVDVNSYSYKDGSLSWSDNSSNGGGAINFVSGQSSSDISPFGLGVVQAVGRNTNSSYGLIGTVIGGSAVGGFSVANGLAVAGSGIADGIISQTTEYLSKASARALASSLAASAAQAAAAASAIARATSSSSVQVFRQGSDLVIKIVRAGANGYQEIESVIDRAGNKEVVQKAYDAAGSLVHYDPK